MEYPRISIITPSLNRRDMLEGVIHNVMQQGYPGVEHIIVDGMSTDGTQEMVKNYPHIRFICGKDEGVYDAFNKGVGAATGDLIGFLNTDDFYAENIFSQVAARFDDSDIMAVAGQAIVFEENGAGKIVARYSPQEKTLLECSTIGNNFFNAWFFQKAVFERIGSFNIAYRVASDRDFMFRLYLNHLKYVTLDKLVYRYRQHPGSLTFDDTDAKREVTARDHLAMTTFYLLTHRLSSNERKLLLELRTREALEIAGRSIRARKFSKALHYVRESVRYDITWVYKPLWPAILNVITWPLRLFRRFKRLHIRFLK